MKLKFLIEISFILKNGEKDKRIVCGVKADRSEERRVRERVWTWV